jgi:hypothetical protein
VMVMETDVPNAFATGTSTSNAAIAVTRGLLNTLSRDELQGVVAHEFSHILNGDMRFNLRLIGILHGILLLSIIGYYILRMGPRGSSRGGRNKGGGGHILLVGLAMWLIGLIGLFFARLIKAAISRQREYLADASAVQFTRYPDGIAGALKKIGGLHMGARLSHPEAESASHMFFGSAIHSKMGGMLDTHPPLGERIQRIDPRFDGKFIKPQKLTKAAVAEEQAGRTSQTRGLQDLLGPLEKVPLSPILVMQAMGTVQPQQLRQASEFVQSLPPKLLEAIHDPYTARAVAFALLLDEDDAIRQQQLQLIAAAEGEPTAKAAPKIQAALEKCGVAARLPVLELLQSSLSNLSKPQYQSFRETVKKLVAADEQITVFEFVMQHILLTHLDRRLLGQHRSSVRYHAVRGLAAEAAQVLALLAYAGHADDGEAQAAFAAGVQSLLGGDASPPLPPRGQQSWPAIGEALNKLAQSSPQVKKRVIAALLATAGFDQTMQLPEAELLRAFADALDCPIPPLWPSSQSPADSAAASVEGAVD